MAEKRKISDVIAAIEEVAPLAMQDSFDNSGLLVGRADDEVESALLCVDITDEVLDEALERGAGLIISHHPLIFHPLKRLTDANRVERLVARAVRERIALYASHTNLDRAEKGLSRRLADILGVRNGRVLVPISSELPGVGYGIVGELEHEMAVGDFLAMLKTKFKIGSIKHSPLCRETVKRVAVNSGSGASFIGAAREEKVDIYVSADFKYNDFFEPDGEFIIADIGHFESELCAIDVMDDIIKKKITTFALLKSTWPANPVGYYI